MTSLDRFEPSRVEAAIHQLGADLWSRMQGQRPEGFDAQHWQGRMLEWAMRDPHFKVDLLRFIDVLPTLKNTQQVTQHIQTYLLKDGRDLPGLGTPAHKAASHRLTAGLAARAFKQNIYDMAERLIAGDGADDAMPILRRLHHDGIAFSLEVLGETASSHAAADAYSARYVDLIDRLALMTAAWPADPVIDANHLGPLPRSNVSCKISALEPHLDAVDTAGSVSRLKARVLPLFLKAKANQVFFNVDLEQWALHGMTYDLFEDIVTDPRLRHWPHVGIVLQTYLHSARQDAERLLQIARQRGTPFTVRLVKGAYWDHEVAHARQHGYPCPVFTDKASTDAAYEALSRFLLDHIEDLHPAFGSHNLRALTHAMAQAQARKVPSNAYELQMLYGMAEPEHQALRAMGHRVYNSFSDININRLPRGKNPVPG